MMQDKEKLFVCYRTGRWGMRIVPHGAGGLLATLGWMIALAPIVVLFIWALNNASSNGLIALTIGLYILALLGWVFAMVRWMKARSEIVDMEELLDLKRERDANKTRRPIK
jgi:hypothetical protein